MQWAVSNGYTPAAPVSQVFKGDLAAVPEVEMQLPVTK
jgi:hypothetical protein